MARVPRDYLIRSAISWAAIVCSWVLVDAVFRGRAWSYGLEVKLGAALVGFVIQGLWRGGWLKS
ncbi:MAG: hypothetical protein U0Q16_36025 [Bryobacteraceae bacterium]